MGSRVWPGVNPKQYLEQVTCQHAQLSSKELGQDVGFIWVSWIVIARYHVQCQQYTWAKLC